MEPDITIGRLFGVRIGLHYSWIVIALLITLSLAARFDSMHPDWTGGAVWLTAIATSLLFFVSIVTHEMAHVTVAKMNGVPVLGVTLFALGGVSQMEREASDARTEFWMGIVGPISSAVIGSVFLGLAMSLGWPPLGEPGTPALAMLVWLGYINLVLAGFNMIPGFPMDGGRVLRAAIWWKTGDRRSATRIAAKSGQGVAFLFIALGITSAFTGSGFAGLWIAFIGWFLLNAARASYSQSELGESLRGLRVEDVMVREPPLADGNWNLQTFVDDHLLTTGRRCFLVVRDGAALGLITPAEVRAVERARWPYTTVYDAMVPAHRLKTVALGTPVLEALEMLGRENVNQMPVVSGDRLEGLISRDQIVRHLTMRQEFGR